MRIIRAGMHLWIISKNRWILGGMGGECFPENIFYFTGYTGRILMMAALRDWDAICEGVSEGVLWSEVILEEVVMYWNVRLSLE